LQVMASTRDGATGRTVMAAVISLIATEIETAAANGATPADIAANLHRIAAPELRKLEGMR
jgi:hypothetical protein